MVNFVLYDNIGLKSDVGLKDVTSHTKTYFFPKIILDIQTFIYRFVVMNYIISFYYLTGASREYSGYSLIRENHAFCVLCQTPNNDFQVNS